MILLAQEQIRGGPNEFLTDPLLTVAAFMLVAVCVLAILFSRLISYNLRRRAWKIRKVAGQLESGMSPDEIREANTRKRHHLHLPHRRKPAADVVAEEDEVVEVETEAEPDYSM